MLEAGNKGILGLNTQWDSLKVKSTWGTGFDQSDFSEITMGLEALTPPGFPGTPFPVQFSTCRQIRKQKGAGVSGPSSVSPASAAASTASLSIPPLLLPSMAEVEVGPPPTLQSPISAP